MVANMMMVEEIVNLEPVRASHEDNVIWYSSLFPETRKSIYDSALVKFPYLDNFIRLHKVDIMSDDFVKHWMFRLLMEIIRG